MEDGAARAAPPRNPQGRNAMEEVHPCRDKGATCQNRTTNAHNGAFQEGKMRL